MKAADSEGALGIGGDGYRLRGFVGEGSFGSCDELIEYEVMFVVSCVLKTSRGKLSPGSEVRFHVLFKVYNFLGASLHARGPDKV